MMKFITRTPFFRLLISLVLGIVFYQYVGKLSLLYLFVLSVCSLPLFLAALLSSAYKYRWLFGCGVSIFFFCFSYFLCLHNERKIQFENLDTKAVFFLQLEEEPKEKRRSFQAKVKIKLFSDSVKTEPSKGRAMLFFQKDSTVSQLRQGDCLLVETEFKPSFSFTNVDKFNYAAYLKRQGIAAVGYVKTDSWKKFNSEQGITDVFQLAKECRTFFLNTFKKFGIEGDEFSVLAALSFGYTDDIDPDLRKNYSASGAMHILAVSGLHVGIIYGLLLFVFAFLKGSRTKKIIKILIILFLLWCYAFITGLQPSVSRSTLMFSMVLLATILDRKPQIYNTIFCSAFFILCLNPNLLFNVGFQLSYSAVLSIVYFQPKIVRLLLFRNKILKWFWELTAVSLAAQIGTLPFVLYYFQNFPSYFLFTNWVAIPLAVAILSLAIALLAFSFVPYLSSCIAFILNYALRFLNSSISTISSLPHSTYQLEINEIQAVFIVVFIFMAVYYIHSKRYFAIFTSLLVFWLFCFVHTYSNYHSLKTESFIVDTTGDGNTKLSFVFGDRRSDYLINLNDLDTTNAFVAQKEEAKRELRVEKEFFKNNVLLCFNNNRVFVLEEHFSQNVDSTFKRDCALRVDFLLLSKGVRVKLDQLLNCIIPTTIIADNSIPFWEQEKIRTICSFRSIQFHSIRQDGMFISNSKRSFLK